MLIPQQKNIFCSVFYYFSFFLKNPSPPGSGWENSCHHATSKTGLLEATVGLRPKEEAEFQGMDINEHGEEGYGEEFGGGVSLSER